MPAQRFPWNRPRRSPCGMNRRAWARAVYRRHRGFLRVPDWLFPLILSPFIGSFVAVLIRRLPVGKPVALSRSRCETCGHVLGPWELIPLASAAILKMRCRWCRTRIPVAHVVVEFACLAIATWAVLIAPDALSVWLDCLL